MTTNTGTYLLLYVTEQKHFMNKLLLKSGKLVNSEIKGRVDWIDRENSSRIGFFTSWFGFENTAEGQPDMLAYDPYIKDQLMLSSSMVSLIFDPRGLNYR